MLASLFDGLPTSTPVLIGKSALAETRVVASIAHIGRDAWNSCFPNEIEDYDYLLAVEQAGIEGFSWRYMTIVQNERVIAAMPVFLTAYQLDTTLDEGYMRSLVRGIRRHWPGFLTLRLACLGSPCTENGVPGFHACVTPDMRSVLLKQLLEGFKRIADAEGCALRGVKDLPDTLSADLHSVFAAGGYAAIPGLATAWLDLDFASVDDYLARLSSGTRKDMRRKLRSRNAVTIEYRSEIADILPRVMELYDDTRGRSDLQFEALTGAYFAGVLRQMQGRAFCTVYKVEDRILAINLLVHDECTLIDKFFCMDAESGRKYNLYYLSWFNNLEYCLKHGMRRYQSGQASYESKVKLGSRLTRNTMFFRHRNPIIQTLLKFVSPMFAIDEKAETKP
ncbi:GNAT family N-acetyltransferase [Ochrobactrum sp. Q0168]|uniref:peptidogalycan biosysnthesis protein n=1 Tax=Ochrobactrum sp. Q0168 TaxID=2793241 RepID=UPI0018ECB04F|nr:GNAT family N-acetyltransferase [Ochrobactrum sp. Q0168]